MLPDEVGKRVSGIKVCWEVDDLLEVVVAREYLPR